MQCQLFLLLKGGMVQSQGEAGRDPGMNSAPPLSGLARLPLCQGLPYDRSHSLQDRPCDETIDTNLDLPKYTEVQPSSQCDRLVEPSGLRVCDTCLWKHCVPQGSG